jgi:hypothetical protein
MGICVPAVYGRRSNALSVAFRQYGKPNPSGDTHKYQRMGFAESGLQQHPGYYQLTD